MTTVHSAFRFSIIFGSHFLRIYTFLSNQTNQFKMISSRRGIAALILFATIIPSECYDTQLRMRRAQDGRTPFPTVSPSSIPSDYPSLAPTSWDVEDEPTKDEPLIVAEEIPSLTTQTPTGTPTFPPTPSPTPVAAKEATLPTMPPQCESECDCTEGFTCGCVNESDTSRLLFQVDVVLGSAPVKNEEGREEEGKVEHSAQYYDDDNEEDDEVDGDDESADEENDEDNNDDEEGEADDGEESIDEEDEDHDEDSDRQEGWEDKKREPETEAVDAWSYDLDQLSPPVGDAKNYFIRGSTKVGRKEEETNKTPRNLKSHKKNKKSKKSKNRGQRRVNTPAPTPSPIPPSLPPVSSDPILTVPLPEAPDMPPLLLIPDVKCSKSVVTCSQGSYAMCIQLPSRR
jgi:hypothetical protein